MVPVLVALVVLLAACGSDQQVTQYTPQGGVHIGHDGIALDDVWVDSGRPLTKGGSAWVRLDVANEWARADRLTGVTTNIARRAQLVVDGHHVDHLELSGHSNIDLEHAAGGNGVHLTGLRRGVARGDWFAITFHFAHAGPITMQIAVGQLGPRVE
jgi:copper(I)-binding protein